jgi:rhodanese-related sulfurtransferase
MKYANRWFWVLLPLLFGGLVACDDDNATDPIPDPVNEAEVLVDYLEATRNYNVQSGFVIKAKDVHTNVVTEANQYVIDIRAASDFATGHIEGAVNVPLGDLATHLAGMNPAPSTYDVVVIACYSGQSAAYATGVVRAMGYENVKSMKWGMSSWHTDFSGSWVNNRSNARATEFETGASPAKFAEGDLPTLNTGFEDGPSILAARGAAVLAEGFGAAKLTNADLFQDLDGHYVMNFWPQDLYENTGHVPGAILYDPSTTPWLSTTYLKTLPTDQPVVTYCYTGQTSAYLTGYLRVLGYDAKTLLFGNNGMIYDKMVTDGVPNAFDPATEIMDYEYAGMP